MNPVFLYYPNLIGYFRVLSAIAAMYYALVDWKITAVLYSVSQGLDALDGVVARHFGQCTKFGQVLDMLTDRASTLGLLCVLSQLYPKFWLTFAGLMALDIVSHWFQTYAKMLEGKTTHKGSDNPLLNFYYSFPYLLICCVGNEGFFICLYALNFSAGPIIGSTGLFHVLAWVFFPISAFKNFMNLVQLYDSCNVVASLDLKELKAKSDANK